MGVADVEIEEFDEGDDKPEGEDTPEGGAETPEDTPTEDTPTEDAPEDKPEDKPEETTPAPEVEKLEEKPEEKPAESKLPDFPQQERLTELEGWYAKTQENDYEPSSWAEYSRNLSELTELRTDKRFFDRAETQKAEELVTTEQQKAQDDAIREGFNTEITDLTKDGSLPKVKDPSATDDPGVVAQKELWEFFIKENDRLIAKGRPIMRSLETAFELMSARKTKADNAEDDKKDAELRRKKGNMVGGGVPEKKDSGKAMHVQGSGKTMDDYLEEELYKE